MAELPVLWHLEISHYNEKVRWALDYKGIPHVRRTVTPALQGVRARRLGAGHTTPILELDGRPLRDSTKIIEEIERRWPQPSLYPADPQERSRAIEWEAFFDECGPHLRRVLFNDTLQEPQKFLAMVYGPGHPAMPLLRMIRPLLCRLARRRYRIWPEPVESSRAVVRGAFEKVASQVAASGYLVGDAFTVADLTAASILGVIVVPPEFPYIHLPPDARSAQFRRFRDSLMDHAGFKWVEEMYARHRGRSAEVAAA